MTYSTSFDDEYESFLNIDTGASPDLKPISMLTPQSVPASAIFASAPTPTFPSPSYVYDQFSQQTGFARGALAETFNINKNTGLQYHQGNNGFIMPTETLNMGELDDFDFSRGDMDFQTDSSPIFLPDGQTQFVSPNTLTQPTSSVPVKRIYPGMHSQQAAQAKAQQASKQEQLARQQQQRSQGTKSNAGPSPTKAPSAKDPLVEESISKVLNRMRQASAASVSEEDDSPTGGMSGMARIKKDEDDMDEDERLLASEEGKKLSSKERRQLRNKVSARAFRSRRKEYIGQLEGELATKAQEANDLRVQNQQLQEENNRLTDLTRMLLSSQSFSGFLQELSQSGLPPPNFQKTVQQPKPIQTQPQPQPIKKDVSSNAANHQMQNQHPQINMALIPETPIDYSALQSSNGWMKSLQTNDFHVYAVTELPKPPVLDIESLSCKPASTKSSSKGLKDLLQLPAAATGEAESIPPEPAQVDESVALDWAAFALYFDSSVCDNAQWVDEGTSTKASHLFEGDDDEALKKLCSDLEDSCDDLAHFTSHMD